MSAQLEPRQLFSERYSDALILACPVCGCDYTHVQRAWALEGSDPFEGGSKNGELYNVPVGGRTAERRGCLVVEIWGECSHVFEIHLQQHKGETFIQTLQTESRP